MKRTITSAGLVVLSVAGVQAAYAPGLSTAEMTKPWSVSAALRGFYDDNYMMRYDTEKRDSFGFIISPSLKLNIVGEQTTVTAGYQYSMWYYADRIDHKADHSHDFNLGLHHAFSERYKLDITDSFVIAQEPQLLAPSGTVITMPLRANGNNLRNHAAISLKGEISEPIGFELGYQNTFYDYQQQNSDLVGTPLASSQSYSSLLNRMEHLAIFNLRWNEILPQTTGILGYNFGITDMTSDDMQSAVDSAGVSRSWKSDFRNSRSHYFYIGADHNFTTALSAALRVGVQYKEFPNIHRDFPGTSDTAFGPYADANVTYQYQERNYVQLGVRHDRNTTDALALDAETTTLYGSINHKITPDLTANLLAQYQHSKFNNGSFVGSNGSTVDGGFGSQSDNYAFATLNFNYDLAHVFSVQPGMLALETGYSYDLLNSEHVYRSYHRNRVYFGIRATY